MPSEAYLQFAISGTTRRVVVEFAFSFVLAQRARAYSSARPSNWRGMKAGHVSQHLLAK
jgi:hypothetical protein